ncbi:MAG: DUF4430 domain-containing protein, partial [Clostridia bacterium]|nr:DUF4430 domain-containing protein [Clostridia bacterium]
MRKICIIFLILLLVFTVGCSQSQEDTSGNIGMIVSKDFGKELISNISIDFSDGQTVLDILEENYEIETAYGGGFVNGIDGLKS